MAITATSATATHRAYQILHFAFVIAPVAAGADKFMNMLTNWEKYLWPGITRLVPAHTFMMVVGAIEIVAGLIVLFKPRIGGFVVGAWLLGIMTNLLLIPGYFDIALRDFGLALGAFSLGLLAIDHESAPNMARSHRTASSTS
jgi:hypothetical protein